jgi:hypothetical protein
MKTKLFVLFIAVAGIFMLQSCEDTLLDFNQTLTYTYEVPVISVDSVFSITEVIDLASQDSVINEYGNLIKEINIQEVKYWLTAFEGDDDQTIIEATLKVADENGAGTQTITTISNQNLKALLNTPTVLAVNQDAINSMQELIKNAPHKFQLSFNNSCNKKPLHFTVKFEFTYELVANPL